MVRCLNDSPVGRLLLIAEGGGLCEVRFFQEPHRDAEGSEAGPEADPGSVDGAVLARAAAQFSEYFAGLRRSFDLPLRARGTPFQHRVWRAVGEVPFGATVSYAEIAERAGGVARAVGGANGANPLPIVVPCHRVIGSNGRLVGYAGGEARKRWLLVHEGVLLPLSA